MPCLAELGVLSWKLDADNHETDAELKKIREERGYSYVVCHLNSAKLEEMCCYHYDCHVMLFLIFEVCSLSITLETTGKQFFTIKSQIL
jgi:hypothetical protein